MARIAGATALCASVLLAGAAGAQQGGESGVEAPLAVRDQNPLLRPFYLPFARLAPPEGFDDSVALAWSNTVNLPQSPTERLYVDEETAEVDLRATWRRGPWLAGAEVPLLWRGGGILDGVIDDFHGLIDANRGYRPYVPSNAFRITYSANGAAPVGVARGPALGDVPLEAGRVLYREPGAELAWWAGAKLPTGSRARASGSGALDAASWLSGGLEPRDRLSLYAQAGIMRPGGAGEFAHVSHWVEFGTLGVSWRAGANASVIAQADLHSALPASELAFLRPALVGTLGARFRLGSDLALDTGIQEDLATNRSPDVTLYVALRHAAAAR